MFGVVPFGSGCLTSESCSRYRLLPTPSSFDIATLRLPLYSISGHLLLLPFFLSLLLLLLLLLYLVAVGPAFFLLPGYFLAVVVVVAVAVAAVDWIW